MPAPRRPAQALHPRGADQAGGAAAGRELNARLLDESRRGPAPEKATFGAYVAAWLLTLPRGPEHDEYRDKCETLTRIHLLPRWGDVLLADIRPTAILAWLQDLEEGSSPRPNGQAPCRLARGSVITIYQVFRTVLIAAEKDGLLPQNSPTRRMKTPRQSGRRTYGWLKPPQVDDLLERVRVQFPNWYAYVYTSVHTGMRRGDLLGLNRENVDLNLRVIRVEHGLKGKRGFRGDTKNGHSRLVAPDEELVQVLRSQLASHPYQPVFPSRTGGHLDGDNVSCAWGTIRRELGVPATRLHDLRHTHGSLLLHAGVDPKTTTQRLGHRSTRMTLDLNGHADPAWQPEGLTKYRASFNQPN